MDTSTATTFDPHAHASHILTTEEEFFGRTTSVFREEHSGFRATAQTMSVAEHVAHVALTVEWFVEGALGAGWDMDFEAGAAEVAKFTSLDIARERLVRAFANARACFAAVSADELLATLPENPIINGPRIWVLGGLEDHTAHHRGALTVYARLLGLEPPMPYM